MPQRFDVVLVPFPLVDGDHVKPRPAIVLAVGERHDDVHLMVVSSRIKSLAVLNALVLPLTEAGLEQTGLKMSSRARITRLVTLSESLMKCCIGHQPGWVKQRLKLHVVAVQAAS